MARGRQNQRHRRGRGRLGLLFKLLCALALLCALTVGVTVFFQVEEIVISGNHRYTEEEIIAASGIKLGDNMYGLNKAQISGDIRLSLPYIEGANIRRNLPSTIVIHVNELGAAASIAVPPPLAPEPAPDKGGEEEPEEDTVPLKAATEPWLINVRGKLLEPSPKDTAAMTVTGLTPLNPEMGTMLKVPEEEQLQLSELVGLLTAMEEQGFLQDVSELHIHATRMDFTYLGRFTVRMPMGEDFRYKLNVLREVVEKTVQKHGGGLGGTIDLTRQEYAVFSPDKE